MKVLWKQSTFIYTTAPNPRCFGHNMRVRLGCGVRKCLLRADVRQKRFAVCLWGWCCEAASSLALQVSWLIFEPWSQKLPMKVLWKQSTFIYTTAPNPRCFSHKIRVRLGCGVRKIFYVLLWVKCATLFAWRGAILGFVVIPSVVALIGFERFVWLIFLSVLYYLWIKMTWKGEWAGMLTLFTQLCKGGYLWVK